MRIDEIPLWALFVGAVAVVILVIDLGYRLGRAVNRQAEREKESSVSAISGAILGFAAFMLAFTFGIVANRYDAKRALVRDDANAVRTTWHRLEFLPESDRAEAADLLRRYVDVRIGFVEAGSLDRPSAAAALAETKRLQDRLWEMAVANARTDVNSEVAALYAESLNQMNAIHATRVAIGMQARIPVEIWITLCLMTTLGMVSVGYQMGIAGSKPSNARLILAVSFALVLSLIASLDRPDSGVMRVTQQPLIDLRSSMGN